MKNNIYRYDNIVIGGNLPAILFSYFNSCPIFFTKMKSPKLFEFFQHNFDISSIKFKPFSKEFRTPKGIKKFGRYKKEVFEKYCFLLSLAGMIPMADKIVAIRINEEAGEVKFSTKGNNTVKAMFKRAYVFDDEGVDGLPEIKKKATDKKYMVIDWADVRSGAVHEFDLIETKDKFVNKIWFYPSTRVDINFGLTEEKSRKDVIIVSYMSKEQIEDAEYSDMFVRRKAIEIMKGLGIQGMNWGWLITGEKRRMPIKMDYKRREWENMGKNVYSETDKIKFNNQTEEEIIKHYLENDFEKTYVHRINNKLSERWNKLVNVL